MDNITWCAAKKPQSAGLLAKEMVGNLNFLNLIKYIKNTNILCVE